MSVFFRAAFRPRVARSPAWVKVSARCRPVGRHSKYSNEWFTSTVSQSALRYASRHRHGFPRRGLGWWIAAETFDDKALRGGGEAEFERRASTTLAEVRDDLPRLSPVSELLRRELDIVVDEVIPRLLGSVLVREKEEVPRATLAVDFHWLRLVQRRIRLSATTGAGTRPVRRVPDAATRANEPRDVVGCAGPRPRERCRPLPRGRGHAGLPSAPCHNRQCRLIYLARLQSSGRSGQVGLLCDRDRRIPTVHPTDWWAGGCFLAP
jgi:hypothetical protein